MNSFKGAGICIIIAGVAFAISRVANTDQVILGVSLGIIAVSLITYAASVKRRRRDRRIATGE